MSSISASKQQFSAGGGSFELSQTTIGIFQSDQPNHQISLGRTRPDHRPLTALQGWILPAGSEGLCEFDRSLDVTYVTLDTQLLREQGLAEPTLLRPVAVH